MSRAVDVQVFELFARRPKIDVVVSCRLNHAVLEDNLFCGRARYVDTDFDLIVRIINNNLVLRRSLARITNESDDRTLCCRAIVLVTT